MTPEEFFAQFGLAPEDIDLTEAEAGGMAIIEDPDSFTDFDKLKQAVMIQNEALGQIVLGVRDLHAHALDHQSRIQFLEQMLFEREVTDGPDRGDADPDLGN